jgi:FtsH-binding integral membrane protein
MQSYNKKDAPELDGARRFLYKILYPFGLISTVVILFIAILAELTKFDADYKPALTLKNVAIILVFCFIFALANRIFSKETLSYGAKITLHCLSLTGDFVLTGIFMSGYYKTGTPAVGITAIFVGVYLVFALIGSIIRYAAMRSMIDRSNYKKQFK